MSDDVLFLGPRRPKELPNISTPSFCSALSFSIFHKSCRSVSIRLILSTIPRSAENISAFLTILAGSTNIRVPVLFWSFIDIPLLNKAVSAEVAPAVATSPAPAVPLSRISTFKFTQDLPRS